MTIFDKHLSTSLPNDATLPLSREFREVFEAEFGYVCRTLRRLGVDSNDVQDVAQELFVTVHRAWSEYDGTRPLKPWLFSFALRFAANYRRLARHRVPLQQPEHEDEPKTAASAQGVEDRDLLLRALARLDFDFRVAVVMHDLAGFSAPEIADCVGAPLNTVYSRIRLARAELKDALTRLGNGGDS